MNSYSKRLELAVGYTISNNDIANSTPNSATTGSEKIVAIPVEAGTGSLLESIEKESLKAKTHFNMHSLRYQLLFMTVKALSIS